MTYDAGAQYGENCECEDLEFIALQRQHLIDGACRTGSLGEDLHVHVEEVQFSKNFPGLLRVADDKESDENELGNPLEADVENVDGHAPDKVDPLQVVDGRVCNDVAFGLVRSSGLFPGKTFV